MTTASPWMTTAEVAQRFQTPESTVRYWRHTGYGPPSVLIGRRRLYAREDVDAWERKILAAGGIGADA